MNEAASATFEAQIQDIAENVRVRSARRVDWMGAPLTVMSVATRRRADDETTRRHLTSVLRGYLYRCFYTSGGLVPVSARDGDGSVTADSGLVARLSAANEGVGFWEPGWRLVTEGSPAVVSRGHLLLWAGDGSWRRLHGDTDVEVRFPKEFRSTSPGFYMFLGNQPLGSGDRIVRTYWHVGPDSAPDFVSEATRRLNEAEVGFRGKVANAPSGFNRADAAVLYLPAAAWDGVRICLRELYVGLRDRMRPIVPSLTLRLAPGLGLAEDPGTEDSFGDHRCRLIAEALVSAWADGLERPAERAERIGAVFSEANVDAARPYLAESGRHYEF